jgi:hypothetical protein
MKVNEILSPKGLDKATLTRDAVPVLAYKHTDKKNILVMDDSPIMTMLIEKDLHKMFNNKDKVLDSLLKEMNRRQYTETKISQVLDVFYSLKEENYTITISNGDKCGYSVKNTVEQNPDFIVHYAILDIILGGIIINERDEFEYVDGIDVGEVLLKKYNTNVLFHTGCSLDGSKESLKLQELNTKYNNFFCTIKNINPYERMLDIILLLGMDYVK